MHETTHDKKRMSAEQSGHWPLGLFCIVTGALALYFGREYEFGNVISMGPGFLPQVLSALLIALGILIVANGGRDVANEEELAPFHARSFLRIGFCIIGSIILFGLTLLPLGLAAATFFMVSMALLALPDVKPFANVITAVALSAFAVLLFSKLLGIAIPVLPIGLR